MLQFRFQKHLKRVYGLNLTNENESKFQIKKEATPTVYAEETEKVSCTINGIASKSIISQTSTNSQDVSKKILSIMKKYFHW